MRSTRSKKVGSGVCLLIIKLLQYQELPHSAYLYQFYTVRRVILYCFPSGLSTKMDAVLITSAIDRTHSLPRH
jgi:hypothetical protein